MSTFSEALQYLAFVEESLTEETASTDSKYDYPAKETPEDRHLKWRRAANAIQPTSKAGFILGVTNRDIERARLLLSGVPSGSSVRLALKRAGDIAFSFLALLLFVPLFLVIAMLIKLDSPGPVLFRQTRIGRHGEPFEMLKFRTMVVEADDPQRTAAVFGLPVLFRLKDDPRVTAVGRWLRTYSFEELPQLWNVLRGQMSVVGPRPPFEAELHSKNFRSPLRPGLTGIWALSSRDRLSWDDMQRLELYYLENLSFAGDIVIFFRTFSAVKKY